MGLLDFGSDLGPSDHGIQFRIVFGVLRARDQFANGFIQIFTTDTRNTVTPGRQSRAIGILCHALLNHWGLAYPLSDIDNRHVI